MTGSREASVQWKPEYDAELRANFDGGLPLSYAEVAVVLNKKFGTNFTRNATIGRGHRLGLTTLRPKGAKTGPKSSRKPRTTPDQRPDIAQRKAAAGPKLVTAPFVPREADVQPHNVPLIELAPNGCRWPSGDGPFVFCNHRQIDGLPYCGPHSRIAYRAPEPRRQRQ